MDIHFNDTLFEVITDYPAYPDFNSALIPGEGGQEGRDRRRDCGGDRCEVW
jgi:hypothetical protein